MRLRSANPASAKGPSPAPKNRFERYPRLALLIMVLVLLTIMLGAVEWSLTLASDRLNLSLANQRGEVRLLRLREWAPGRVQTFAAPEGRSNDSIGPVDREYELRIDSAGFIWPSIVHAQPDFEIAFLGGSTTECLYVRPTMRFPHLVGRMLEARTGLKINSLNAGKSGNNSMHSVLDYLGKVAPRRPRFVVLMEAVNDIGVLNREKTYWNDDKAVSLVLSEHMLEGRRPVEDFVRRVREHTIPYTYRVIQRGFDALAQRIKKVSASRASAPHAVPAAPAKVTVVAPDESEIRRRELLRASFEPALKSFVRLAKAWGSEPILMTQVRVEATAEGDSGANDFLSPEQLRKGNFDTASFASIHDYANTIIRHVAVTEGALLIDLVAARQWTRDDVYDSLHFTETGSRHVAEIIDQALAPLIVPPEMGKRSDARALEESPGAER
jgi:lysophospholipase L1-like esterase